MLRAGSKAGIGKKSFLVSPAQPHLPAQESQFKGYRERENFLKKQSKRLAREGSFSPEADRTRLFSCVCPSLSSFPCQTAPLFLCFLLSGLGSENSPKHRHHEDEVRDPEAAAGVIAGENRLRRFVQGVIRWSNINLQL